ncbi:hypothetical protein Ancab_015048 [Ancistrocladus abbreviatus]
MAEKHVNAKLLIDTKTNKVLFAEGGKDFVDFLFYILSLRVGAVVRLLTKETMAGSLGNLYDSVESLSNDYIQPTFHKDSLLKPSLSPCKADIVPLQSTAQAPIRSLGYDNGFVKGLVNYMIMDDLAVKPMSTVLVLRFSISLTSMMPTPPNSQWPYLPDSSSFCIDLYK